MRDRAQKIPANGNASDDGLDINNGSGRVAFSPMLAVEVAASNYYGNQSPFSYNPLNITAIDWTLQKGPFELIGEAAWAYSRGNSRAIPGSTFGPSPGSVLTGLNTFNPLAAPPQRMQGFYLQGNYHFMPAFLTRLSPKRFGEGSTFTAVIRYDLVNLNRDNQGENQGELEQISFGLNYRPVEDAVFKISYQYLPKSFTQIPENEFTTGRWCSQPPRTFNRDGLRTSSASREFAGSFGHTWLLCTTLTPAAAAIWTSSRISRKPS